MNPHANGAWLDPCGAGRDEILQHAYFTLYELTHFVPGSEGF